MKKKLNTKEEYQKRVDQVISYIRSHLDSPLSIDELASISAFSPFHFHRVISAFIGEPIGAFIVRTRMEMAANLLRYTTLPIQEIAYRVGYDTPSSLTKAFKKFFHVSPSEYKNNKNFRRMETTEAPLLINLSKPKIVEVSSKQLLYVTVKGEYSSIEYGTIFSRLWQEIKEQKLFTAGIEHLALYYCNPDITESHDLMTDVCLSIHKPAEPNNEVGVKELPGGKYALFTYTGPYSNLKHVYDKIYGEWFPESGFEMVQSFNFEKYISDPQRVAPEKLKTEIYIPIK